MPDDKHHVTPMPVDRIKHLELISNVITRLSSNAFYAKAGSITIASALIAAATKADRNIALITILTSPAMWIVDAYYLSLERQFRGMFAAVALSREPADFLMNPDKYERDEATWRRSLWSRSMLIYIPVALSGVLVWGAAFIPH